MKNILFFLALLVAPFFANASEVEFRSRLSTMLMMRNLHLDSESRAHLIHQRVYQNQGAEWMEVNLGHDELGEFQLLMKGSPGFSQQFGSQRALLLVSGFFTGQDSVRLFENLPNTVVVGFQYAYNLDDFKRDPGTILQFMRKTPGQIALALAWLNEQGWLAPGQLTAMGVSLGGILLPSAIHFAQEIGSPISRSVFVCTGAHLTPILEANLRGTLTAEQAQTAAWGMANITSVYDPKIHLPFLTGSFLTIRTDHDQVIPEESGVLLEELLPKSKTNVVLSGRHVNTDEVALIQKIRETVIAWMTGQLRK